jgi:ActR/RegA family two-component response regulator
MELADTKERRTLTDHFPFLDCRKQLMPYRESKSLNVREQVQLKYARRAAKLVNVFQCLIVSADPRRRRMLEQAAAEGGWKTFPCADAPSALTHIHRWLMQLAVVDLEAQAPESFRPLVEQLTACSGLLSIVCGNEGNVEEEIWARQRGAWMYLPGVSDSSNVSLLCGEARQIAERLWKAGGSERTPAQPVA